MHFNFLAGLAKPLGLLTAGAGFVVLGASTLGEHVDDVIKIGGSLIGTLLIIVGFWIVRWIVRRESFETQTLDLLGKHGDRLTQVEANHKSLLDRFVEEVHFLRRHADRQSALDMYTVVALEKIANKQGIDLPLPPMPPGDSGEHLKIKE